MDEMREQEEARREALAAQNRNDPRLAGRVRQQEEEREVEVEVPKPTIQLSSLPPNMAIERLKSLLDGHLTVHDAQFLPPARPGTTSKRSKSAIVTLSAETSSAQIDTAVSALKDKYLGYGFYLSISRHLSSTALHPTMSAVGKPSTSEPFGAEMPKESDGRPAKRNEPPPSDFDNRSFASRNPYNSRARPHQRVPAPPAASVDVRAPLGIETIRAIHVVVESLTSERDPFTILELEAALMATPKVQTDERYAFLFESRSLAAVYYRFLLWGSDDPEQDIRERKRRAKGQERVHYDHLIDWTPPYSQVVFPDLTSLADVLSDIDYDSSDEEKGGEEEDKKGKDRIMNAGLDGDADPKRMRNRRFSPLKRARLVHMLSRLPTINTKLRKGDVARITNFAIIHAGEGAEEIVDVLLLNVAKPFSSSLASKYEEEDSQDAIEEDEEDEYEPGDDLPTFSMSATEDASHAAPPPNGSRKRDATDDPSNAKLVALYIISDVLSASSTAGAKNAWKYRQLIELSLIHI